MSERRGIYSILGRPAIYQLFRAAVLGDGCRIHMSEYVKPLPGEKVLDIGCGPGDILHYLPAVEYLGFDINPQYIQSAQQRFARRGRFFCGDVGLATIEQEAATFDLVLATGVLHHLDDEQAMRLFRLAHQALKPAGRLVTFDGCFVAGQSKLSRFVVSRDRGQFVRRPDEYRRLAASAFQRIESSVRHDLLRIPYTHLILRCFRAS